ncbi:MAG: hypothetical protein ABW321_32375 [Polyangiales bacterium]
MRVSGVPGVVLAAVVLTACDESDDATTTRADASVHMDAAPSPRDASTDGAVPGEDAAPPRGGAGGKPAGGAGGTAAMSLPCDDLDAPFERAGEDGTFVARYLTSDPALVYRGRYDWTLELLDAAGEGIGDAELKAKAVMRAHGHGTSPIKVQHEAGSSRYELLDVNLFMAGKWEVTLSVKTTAGDDSAELRACPLELPDDEADAGDDAGPSKPRGGHG